MSEINDLLAKIAEPETPEERDEAWNEVADRLRLMDAMHKELNALCDWGDEAFMHAYVHIGNVIKNLRADVSTERTLREKAEAKLRGYETAPVHVAADVLRSRLRETAQILIEAVGADGPMDAEDAARKAVGVIEDFEESLEICLGPQSPLPPLAKDVVRGAFITTAKRRGDQ